MANNVLFLLRIKTALKVQFNFISTARFATNKACHHSSGFRATNSPAHHSSQFFPFLRRFSTKKSG